MINSLFEDYKNLKEVEAIALGGSRAGAEYDEKSDYDVYLYISESIDESERRGILKEYCDVIELGNHFWETEDNCVLKNGTDIDILYRNLDEFINDVADVAEKHNPRNAYTTCMWHNLKTCKIIFDRNGRLEKAKERFDIPYPPELKKNIIENNMRLLHNSLPAYDKQIIKAAQRGDLNSVNHRVTGFMEAYFDLIFALNEMTHPGEKRLVKICKAQCKILPKDFEENINAVFSHMFINPEKTERGLQRIISELNKVLKQKGYRT
ncbi:MAG: DUF4037 domain-containing protein [Ruminococcus sp.]|nr:DUF4037 domain-containing protein [Ruminococcus sp.]